MPQIPLPDTTSSPRWPGGPRICNKQNLPSFDTMAQLKTFFDGLPAVSIKRTGLCEACGSYHAETKMRPPSGATSGSSSRDQTGRK